MDRVVGVVAGALLLFLYIPIVTVVAYSFNASSTTSLWSGVTVNWYLQLLQDQDLLEALRLSAVIGAIAGVLSTAIGFLSALGLTRYRVRGRAFFLGSVLLPLILPEIVLGAALLTVLSAVRLPLGVPTIVIGHVVICLPLTTLILMGAMSTLDPSLSEAAADLGCTPWSSFTRVLLPLLRSSVLAAFLLAFTTSFSNIVVSTFTSGVGSTTLPLRIFSLLKTGITPEINALGALLIVGTILLILVVGLAQMRRILVGSDPAPE